MPNTPPPAINPNGEYPNFLNNVTTALDRLTTQANSLPPKSDLAFHKTLDRTFARDIEGASTDVLGLTERLLGLVAGSPVQGGDSGSVNGKVGNDGKMGKVGVGNGKGKVRRKVEEEEDVVEGYKRFVGDVVDGLLEDADTCIDELNGQKKKGAISVRASLEAKAGLKLPGPLSIQRAPPLATSMFNPSNLPKPQLNFPIPIDNSPIPYTPSLTSKPHSLVPLTYIPTLSALEIPTDPLRKLQVIKSLSHPYYYETRHLPYPTSMFTHAPPIHPGSMGDSEAIWVDTPQALEEMVGVLKGEGVKEVAVDLEHHNVRSYHGFTCLIQVSTRVVGEDGEVKAWDWIVDALKLRGELKEGKFGGVFVDPGVVKVFHGSDSDIPWLQKDFDIHIVNLFDTYHATHVLGKTNHSLKALLAEYCDYETDKRLATSDWRIRPLPREMFEYARSDTHFLLYIYDHLRNALLEKSKSRASTPLPDAESSVLNVNMDVDVGMGSTIAREPHENPQKAMREVLALSADTALKVYEREMYDWEFGRGPSGWAGSGRKYLGKSAMDREEGLIWRRIHAWRDGVARELDESPHYVMPAQVMGAICVGMPLRTVEAVKRTIGVLKAPIVHEKAEEIVEVVRKAKEEWGVLKQQERNLQAVTAQAQQGGEGVLMGNERLETVNRLEDVIGDLLDKATTGSVSIPGTATSTTPKSISSGTTSTVNELIIPSRPYDASLLWDTVGPSSVTGDASTVRAAPAPKATQSGLFGKTLSSNRPVTAAPTAEASRSNESSSLFGKTLNASSIKRSYTTTAGDSDFAAVLKGINESITPAQPVQPIRTESQVAKQTVNALPEVETVPFIPIASRSTLPPSHPPIAPVKEKERDTIVQVKKSKSKGKNKASVPNSITVDPSGGHTLSEATSASPAKKSRREKKVEKEGQALGEGVAEEAGEIVEFDYSKAPNLLDNPNSGVGADDKEKKRKPKPTRSGPLDTNFGKVPKDRSQPKQGNKSGTF